MSQFPLEQDPERQQELEKYDSPTASRNYILQVLEQLAKPAELDELCQCFAITDEEAIQKLGFRLRAMERQGQIIRDRRARYGLIEHMNVQRGKVIGHPDGFGFVKLDKGGEDWFLTPREMRFLLPNDTVLVTVKGINRKGRIEAAVARIVEEGTKTIVGQYHHKDGLRYVVPEDKRISFDIQIDEASTLKAKKGELVLMELTRRPGRHEPAMGHLVEVLGQPMAPGMEIAIALRAFDLPFAWPEQVTKEVAAFKTVVSTKDIKGRIDLSHLPLVTIDGADARDFDDAVYCEAKVSGGWRLWVAIADVSHYVKPDSALDLEAQNRGNSIYFPGEVIPMLPEVLSNGLCSLNPDVPRLAMVCEMTISAKGKLSGYQFYPAVIRSHARLIYDQVWQYLSNQESGEQTIEQVLGEGNQKLAGPLNEIYALYKVLAKARSQRGCIEFETTETQFLFNQQRKIERIVPTQRNHAHKLIEECMIMANVASARFLLKTNPTGIYRSHSGPTQKKLETLRGYLGQHGLTLTGGDDPSPADFSYLLESIKDRTDVEQIQIMMLRSLSQAIYAVNNDGHFGLALAGYSHFTSPIRRYPDLMLHRLIKARLKKNGSKDKGVASGHEYEEAALSRLADQCSITERRADEATRDVSDWLKCEFMQDKLGQKFTGKVVTVTGFGLFVRLDEVYVEGLLHISALSRDYYRFEPTTQTLVGERTGQSFGVGDEMTIKVAKVSLEDRKIDFDLVSLDNSLRRPEKANKSKGRPSNKTDSSRKESGKIKAAKKPSAKKGSGKKDNVVRKKTRTKKTLSKKLTGKKNARAKK